MAERCRHVKMWVIAGGWWYWCYECGALRQAERGETGSYPISRWIKPTGKGGNNPTVLLNSTTKRLMVSETETENQ